MKYILFLLIIFVSSEIFAQAKFFEGTYKETLEYAKTKNKKVILLFENDYCVPCKKLKKVFFQDKENGDFLNQYFVIRKVNAIVKSENGRNVYEDTPDGNLAKMYEVGGFPNLVILKVDSLPNPTKIVKLQGLYLGEVDPEGHINDNFPVDEKFDFRIDEIKKMFYKYIKS